MYIYTYIYLYICIYIHIYTAAHRSWDNKHFFKKAILVCNYVIEFLIYINKNYIFYKFSI